MMRFGFGVLRLSSQEFWSLTFVEYCHAFDVYFGENNDAINKQTLQYLMQAHPDENHDA